MKTKIIITAILSILAVTISSKAFADNPYEEGVKRRELTAAEKQSLLLYANNSKALLDRAMQNAQGKSMSEANTIYLRAIKTVVAESFREKRRSELLMRMALNQALELTFGVPTENASGVQKPGVINGVANQDILTIILEDSIKLALQYYRDDRDAISKGTLIELPYIAFAGAHLNLAREWLASVTEWNMQLALSQALLEQWQTTVLQEDHMTQARIAEAILDVEDALKQITDSQYSTQQKVRFLRGIISRTLKVMPLSSVPGYPGSVNSSIGTFIRIPRGTFMMGSPSNEANRESDEAEHQVTLTRDFEMAVTTVTQSQWVGVMASNPSYFKYKNNCQNEYKEINGVAICPNHPVEQVSWNDVQAFIDRLNGQKDGYTYRLPTEAEWEYAARAGTKTAYYFGDNPGLLTDYAWFSDNSSRQTHSVAQKKANAWGLYDMHGNVWQWVQDYYASYHPSGSVSDPLSSSGSGRVLRGGSWFNFAQFLRSAFRNDDHPDGRNSAIGFRLVRTRK